MRASRDYVDNLITKNQQQGNYVTLKFGRRTIDALVDSGAAVSIISERTARSLNLNIIPLNFNERFRLWSANGTQISVIGMADIRLYFNGLIISQQVRVSPNIQHSILLGLDFLQSNSVILNYKLGILSLKDDLVRVPLHSKLQDLNCVTSVRTTCIPAFTEAWI